MTRVNIQYSIELSEIPDELDRMRATEQHRLTEAWEALKDINFHGNLQSSAEGIEAVRRTLFAVDERLSDMDAIVKGFHAQQAQAALEPHAQQQQAQQQEHHQQGNKVSPASPEAMETIKAELASHRADLASLENTFRSPAVYGEFGSLQSDKENE